MITGMTKRERAESIEDWRKSTSEPNHTPLASELEPTMRGTRQAKATRAFNVICDAFSAVGNPWRHQ